MAPICSVIVSSSGVSLANAVLLRACIADPKSVPVGGQQNSHLWARCLPEKIWLTRCLSEPWATSGGCTDLVILDHFVMPNESGDGRSPKKMYGE
jgi:hypothetical protein